MIPPQPKVAEHAKAIPGGLDNPLAARTLHFNQDGNFTIYDNNDPDTIGRAITSGCVGLLSRDMIHLYARTPVKTRAVLQAASGGC